VKLVTIKEKERVEEEDEAHGGETCAPRHAPRRARPRLIFLHG